ncbi:MAG: 2-(1,2-epoxy-1,2-dihydrophenyl)acetyl-CoA isomerase PaaG [Candidatus Accumulibacter sp.]|uniref:2-(1,2-epoxy-1,2-dihydrophenyl)acetyl-CoA isomerase PaaG n=1 Tax=Accumulibacter sp. TaxID=2053492 RepID=UPI00287AAF20|nr:2-(1,2-epoxy-1,2-dihydrophenyl)acetyl-CoA isomerase PaaG [Accumulibacter sp.]MDS4014033.1 2-(1,2-epoxy-1,2-dihydrophenyl)acetyl-CoA isomerase PaaG [Accumulibacter sp.]
MSFATINYAVDAGIARITLNRPDRLNSFNEVMHEEIRRALSLLEVDASARVLVVDGAGRAFCAGQDLSDPAVAIGDQPPAIGDVIERNYKPLVLRLHKLPMPTLCAVHGVAAGAGVSLALACDIVVAARSASFLQAFSRIGLIPDTGGTWFLPQRVGMARALGLALLAERLSAEQAADWGLIWACVDDLDLLPTVDRLAGQLAASATRALVRTREAMRAGMSNSLERQLDVERDIMQELGRSHDYQEGVSAFMAKRAARFRGE